MYASGEGPGATLCTDSLESSLLADQCDNFNMSMKSRAFLTAIQVKDVVYERRCIKSSDYCTKIDRIERKQIDNQSTSLGPRERKHD